VPLELGTPLVLLSLLGLRRGCQRRDRQHSQDRGGNEDELPHLKSSLVGQEPRSRIDVQALVAAQVEDRRVGYESPDR
jgi:hypothetical protein